MMVYLQSSATLLNWVLEEKLTKNKVIFAIFPEVFCFILGSGDYFSKTVTFSEVNCSFPFKGLLFPTLTCSKRLSQLNKSTFYPQCILKQDNETDSVEAALECWVAESWCIPGSLVHLPWSMKVQKLLWKHNYQHLESLPE